MTNQRPTASATAYNYRRNRITAQLARIEAALQQHAIRQEQEPSDWGYAGTLGRVMELLGQVEEVLGSNCKETEI
jgi:hypothetical protein